MYLVCIWTCNSSGGARIGPETPHSFYRGVEIYITWGQLFAQAGTTNINKDFHAFM